MKKVKTVFKINGASYTVEAVGQDAINAIRKGFRGSSIFLSGFYVNDKFIPVNLN